MANSFVFIDLETHDLRNPKITEICLVAVLRKHILDANQKKEFDPPRILNKISLCVNPQILIHPRAAEMTGLSNELLEECPVFNSQTAAILHNFIITLPQPVCMVAHNGLKFDYPVLKSALQNLNQSLPDLLRCADTLPGFRSVFKTWNSAAMAAKSVNNDADVCMISDSNQIGNCNNMQNTNHVKASTSKSAEEWLNDDNDAYFLNVDCEKLTAEADAIDLFSQVEADDKSFNLQQQCSQLSWDIPCSKTPKRPRVNDALNGSESPDIVYVDVETNQVMNQKSAGEPAGSAKVCAPEAHIAIRKDLYPFAAPASYRLEDVYKTLRGKTPVGHQAEADVLSMLECVLVMGPEIVQFFDENYTLFQDIVVPDIMRS